MSRNKFQYQLTEEATLNKLYGAQVLPWEGEVETLREVQAQQDMLPVNPNAGFQKKFKEALERSNMIPPPAPGKPIVAPPAPPAPGKSIVVPPAPGKPTVVPPAPPAPGKPIVAPPAPDKPIVVPPAPGKPIVAPPAPGKQKPLPLPLPMGTVLPPPIGEPVIPAVGPIAPIRVSPIAAPPAPIRASPPAAPTVVPPAPTRVPSPVAPPAPTAAPGLPVPPAPGAKKLVLVVKPPGSAPPAPAPPAPAPPAPAPPAPAPPAPAPPAPAPPAPTQNIRLVVQPSKTQVVSSTGLVSVRDGNYKVTIPDLNNRAIVAPSRYNGDVPNVVLPDISTYVKPVTSPHRRPAQTVDIGARSVVNLKESIAQIFARIDVDKMVGGRIGKNKQGYSLEELQGFAKELGIAPSSKGKQKLIDEINNKRREAGLD
jgi:hypothetical protein